MDDTSLPSLPAARRQLHMMKTTLMANEFNSDRGLAILIIKT
jgi:hypothetical protein